MRKLLVILLALFILTGCSDVAKQNVDPNQRYLSIIEAIEQYDNYVQTSNYYDISVDMASIDGGYRYYVTIDNPHVAMYDVEAIAIEKGIDYKNIMAANIGIFDENEYTMIPNQKNPDKGYVSGVVISGVSENANTTLYIYVSFKNSDYSSTHVEYLKLDVNYEG